MVDDDNGWIEYKLFIKDKLNQHTDQLGDIADKLEKVRAEIEVLKVKSGIWGFAAGLLAVLTYLLISFVGKQ